MADKKGGQVVEAHGAAGGQGPSAKEIEAAMVEATEKAMAAGITDPEKILELKMQAREAVKKKHADQAAKK